MPKTLKQIIVAYVPVVHRGYLQLFAAFPAAENLYVLGEGLIAAEDYLRKDLRALSPKEQVNILSALGRFKDVEIVDGAGLAGLDVSDTRIIMPDDDLSHALAKRFKQARVEFYPVFLRWDRRSVDARDSDGEVLAASDTAVEPMLQALEASAGSSDIWRRVGAALLDAKGGLLGVQNNQGEPTPYSPWMEGDPRNVFNRGVGIEMSVYTHAEAALIAEAAKRGQELDGGMIYVTTFPCPACAKLIARAGLKSCYYLEGYAVLDGRRIMEQYGVHVARIEIDDAQLPPESPAGKVPYKKF